MQWLRWDQLQDRSGDLRNPCFCLCFFFIQKRHFLFFLLFSMLIASNSLITCLNGASIIECFISVDHLHKHIPPPPPLLQKPLNLLLCIIFWLFLEPHYITLYFIAHYLFTFFKYWSSYLWSPPVVICWMISSLNWFDK